MKSIRYKLFGTMRNIDDCLDFLKKEKPLEVSLDLITDEYVSEMYIVKHFLGKYEWKFPNMTIKFEKVYDGCFHHETEKKQKLNVDNSNNRLEKDIKRIEKLNLKIKGKEKRFDYSMIYKQMVEQYGN